MSTVGSVVDLLLARHPCAVELLHGDRDRPVGEVLLIEEAARLDDAAADAVVVLERSFSPLLADYRFDVLVRRAAARDVAAVLVVAPARSRISITALALAVRSDTAIVRLGPEVDLTAAVRTVIQESAHRLGVTVDRVRRVGEVLARTRFDDVDGLLDEIGMLLGRVVRLGERPDGGEFVAVPAAPDRAGGRWLWAERDADLDADALLEMVLWRVAAETARMGLEHRRAETVSRRSAGEALIQLIDADRAGRAAIAPSARRLGIPVYGWHVLTRIELDNLLELSTDDVAAYETRDELASIALRTAAGVPGAWTVAHDPGVLLLLWTGDEPPAPDTAALLRRRLDLVLTALVGRVRGLRMYSGAGTARPGVAGLAGSATEARLAVSSARFRRRVNVIVHYDAVGLRATLLEWYASPTVRQSIDRLFAPIEDLSPARRQTLIDTVCTYLDLQGSAARAAEHLHLHRNAVRYRVQRAFALLGIDEDDADQRLFLHLACRAQRTAGDG